jgi:hypothetical protein
MQTVSTTIFCVVSSSDANRHKLLKEHQENILSQTKPIKAIYVFERDDCPPSGLFGEKIITSRCLTIYEAFNYAITACQTDFIMNLNLDDRLNYDAVSIMEQKLIGDDTLLVGGDWKICHSQDETNNVSSCTPANDIPFIPSWPPELGVTSRLGSGTGERGTYGPSTLWRMKCHEIFSRYPYRTTDGIKIKSIADSIWWSMLSKKSQGKLSRMPMIIGNYHSHPSEQAEFRHPKEHGLLNGKQISLI